MNAPSKILVVDDTPKNVKLLADLLSVKGYAVVTAASGREALAQVDAEHPDLVLLDVVMPEMSGYEVCRKIRESPATEILPVVMVTALDPGEERVNGLQAGADDFLTKPINQAELLARVRSLLRIKELYDTVQAQAAQLAKWNQTLTEKVRHQVEEQALMGRLRRYLSPQVAKIIFSSGSDPLLENHRREITVVFLDLRGFTAFSDSAEPEEVMDLLRSYHTEMGKLIFKFEGTVEHFAGDGIMVFFNDPIPCADHTERAVRMAVEIRARVKELQTNWLKKGYDVDLGVGITAGYATLGNIGFEGRLEYAAVGTIVNLAARLCGEAKPGQIVVSKRLLATVEEIVEAEPIGELTLKGFVRPVTAYNILRLKS